jgi:flavodoxin
MNIEVRYLSKSGNTKKVAEAIAEAVGVLAMPTDEPVKTDTDLLFLGGAIYAFGLDEGMARFISSLPKTLGHIALFSTTAVVPSAAPKMKALIVEQGISVLDDEFHCWGAFTFMHAGRPNANDLEKAATFAKRVVARGI